MMSNVLTGFVQRITGKKLNVLSARVRQGGRLAGQWDASEDIRRVQHSVSKSFTCMAAGLAIEEGKLALDTTLGDVFPQHVREGMADDPPLSPAASACTICCGCPPAMTLRRCGPTRESRCRRRTGPNTICRCLWTALPASSSPTAAATPS